MVKSTTFELLFSSFDVKKKEEKEKKGKKEGREERKEERERKGRSKPGILRLFPRDSEI